MKTILASRRGTARCPSSRISPADNGKTKDFVKRIEAIASDKDATRTVIILKNETPKSGGPGATCPG